MRTWTETMVQCKEFSPLQILILLFFKAQPSHIICQNHFTNSLKVLTAVYAVVNWIFQLLVLQSWLFKAYFCKLFIIIKFAFTITINLDSAYVFCNVYLLWNTLNLLVCCATLNIVARQCTHHCVIALGSDDSHSNIAVVMMCLLAVISCLAGMHTLRRDSHWFEWETIILSITLCWFSTQTSTVLKQKSESLNYCVCGLCLCFFPLCFGSLPSGDAVWLPCFSSFKLSSRSCQTCLLLLLKNRNEQPGMGKSSSKYRKIFMRHHNHSFWPVIFLEVFNDSLVILQWFVWYIITSLKVQVNKKLCVLCFESC